MVAALWCFLKAVSLMEQTAAEIPDRGIRMFFIFGGFGNLRKRRVPGRSDASDKTGERVHPPQLFNLLLR